MASSSSPPTPHCHHHRLIVLYGIGGLSDVGRHAVQVAHDLQKKQQQQGSGVTTIQEVVVLTKHPDLLLKDNWNCGCPDPHSLDLLKATGATTTTTTSSTVAPPIRIVKVDDWKDPALHPHFGTTATDAVTTTTSVLSCLGNRQTIGHNDASEAMEHLILPAMAKHKVQRLVLMTSVGVEEDWPPLEFFAIGKCVLSCMFVSTAKRAFQDLTRMERLVRATPEPKNDNTGVDYLLVRPVGIGEDVKPVGQWQLQREKYKDKLDFNMAKLDVARFMVLQALRPTLHRTATVIGGVLDASAAQKWDDDALLEKAPTTARKNENTCCKNCTRSCEGQP